MFISFEGIEGSGKSTACRAIGEALQGLGHKALLTKEPGGSPLGRELRAILLDSRNKHICTESELFLYLADRAQHVREVIRPALAQGKIVLSDRYADSTTVYQGYGRGLGPEELHALNEKAVDGLWPDLTLVFDLDEQTGLARARTRNAQEGKSFSEGRFEAEDPAFHQRVRHGFLDWAARFPQRFRIIDASGTPEEVFKAARDEIVMFFPGLRPVPHWGA